jgi:hypothetical protein
VVIDLAANSESKSLDAIRRNVDEIKSLILFNGEKLEEAKQRPLPEESIRKVYCPCDGNRTTSDIAQTLQKSNDYVSSYLSILRREGIVRTIERDGKLVHEQIF